MKRFLSSIPGIIAIVGIIALALVAAGVFQSSAAFTTASNPRQTMQIVISLVVLAASLWVILSNKYEPDVQKWAYGATGTIIGYWLPTVAEAAKS